MMEIKTVPQILTNLTCEILILLALFVFWRFGFWALLSINAIVTIMNVFKTFVIAFGVYRINRLPKSKLSTDYVSDAELTLQRLGL